MSCADLKNSRGLASLLSDSKRGALPVVPVLRFQKRSKAHRHNDRVNSVLVARVVIAD